MAEWLRRWTRNPLGSPRAGSNPADYGVLQFLQSFKWIDFIFVLFRVFVEIKNRWFTLPPCRRTKRKQFVHIVCMKMEVKSRPRVEKITVPVHQHGRHDVTCKPPLGNYYALEQYSYGI